MTSDETISINDLTLCHKHSRQGLVRSTLPDVCKSPTQPVPYTNVAYARDLENGTTTVFSHGGAMNGIKGSRFYPSYSDEPGVGGGVKSGVNQHEATWLSWSPNVFMQGKAVTRLTDKMLMNKGNTISAGGYYTGKVQGSRRTLLNKLCNYACECKTQGRQRCVELKLMQDIAKGGDPLNADWPELNIGYDGVPMLTGAGLPSRRRGVPVGDATRMDVTQLSNGKPTSITEMKFAGDYYHGDQEARIDSISKKLGFKKTELNVETDCKCDDDDKEKKKSPATSPSKQEEDKPFSERHPYIYYGGMGVAGVGLVAGTWYMGGAPGLAVLGSLFTANSLATQ